MDRVVCIIRVRHMALDALHGEAGIQGAASTTADHITQLFVRTGFSDDTKVWPNAFGVQFANGMGGAMNGVSPSSLVMRKLNVPGRLGCC